MSFLMKYFIGGICLLTSFAYYWLMYTSIRSHILEIGYRSKRKFRRGKGVSFWQHYLLLDICKNAKVNKRTVWYFFSEFILICGCAVISCVFWVCSFAFPSYREIVVIQLGFGTGALILIGVIDTFLAQQFVPSAQRRHRPIPKFTKDE
jgi:hypothetical protein